MANQAMRLSIVLATYNGATYLPDQLESLARQTRLPDELLISDDGSTDATLDIVAAFARTASFPVRLHQQPVNLGPQQNFGKALALAEGDILFTCDQDDVWYPDKLARMAAIFENDPTIALAMCDADLVDITLRPLDQTLWEALGLDRRRQDLIENKSAPEVLAWGNFVYGCTMAVRASLRQWFLPIPQGANFDTWTSGIVAACGPCRLIREPLQAYRQHSGQAQSVGRDPTLLKLYRIWANSNSAAVVREIEGLDAALNRLSIVPDSSNRAVCLGMTINRLKLARCRLRARRSLLWRVPLIAKSLLNGNYHRSAQGLLSAAVDLIARQN